MTTAVIRELKNIFSKDALESNMIFTSFYIAIYENLVGTITEKIKNFLCLLVIEDGELISKPTEKYNSLIKNRQIDKKGNKDIVKASFLWLIEMGAITQEDYKTFLQIKNLRNRYAHSLLEVLYKGVEQDEILRFFQLRDLYTQIDKWWINEIEIPTSGNFQIGQYDPEDVSSVPNMFFDAMIDILYRGKADEYAKFLNNLNII